MMARVSQQRISAELVAVLTAVVNGTPVVLLGQGGSRLPSGPLQSEHRSMQAGLRAWVHQQTGHALGYVEQLYTFADQDRREDQGRSISVSYLGLTRTADGAGWRPWYEFFPWEDHRPCTGDAELPPSELIATVIAPALHDWAEQAEGEERTRRHLRAAVCFGLEGHGWAAELALQRYELLYEAGLIAESAQHPESADTALLGPRLESDHRRMLATALARLRSKIQYHPVVFELLPDSFTLGQLQATVEALAGQTLHKQNFRRLVTQQDLVEETGETDTETGGRPARKYRFRRAVLDERHVAGTKLPRPR